MVLKNDTKFVLLLGCSWDYVSVLVSTVIFRPKVFRSQLMFELCFDAKFAEWYESHGELCAQNDRRGQEIQDINGPYGSFKVRSSVVAGLLERGYDVLLSDTDYMEAQSSMVSASSPHC